MKNFKLENITIEISCEEALIIRNALEHYRDTRIDSIYVWSEADDDWLQRNYGKTHEEMNIMSHKKLEKRCNEMMEVLWNAYMGYPFK